MITSVLFGIDKQGEPIHKYSVRDQDGCGVDCLDYGCIIQALFVKDRQQQLTDVCLGYDTLDAYLVNGDYMGAVLGRCANRIANAQFTLNGQPCHLSANDGINHIHGGLQGFHRRRWDARIVDDQSICFSRRAADGEEGYPGNLDVSVTYRFEHGCLTIDYRAVSDADTVVNLSNHTYFNLSGGHGDALSHWLTIHADTITENDAQSLPTGVMLPVAGTAFDFRTPRRIGERINWPDTQLSNCGGYDHDFALAGANPAAVLWHEDNGIRMTVRTDMPSLELYTANSLKGEAVGKYRRILRKRSGVCLETQYFPNAMACPAFVSPILRRGETYRSQTRFCFDVLPLTAAERT